MQRIKSWMMIGLLSCVSAWGISPDLSLPDWTTQLKIDRIEIQGIKALPAEAVERLLEVHPGEQFDRVRVLHTVDQILALYHNHGYDRVEIQSRLLRRTKKEGVVLEFSVVEKEPIRIAAIHLRFLGSTEKLTRALTRTWEEKIRTFYDLKVGDILDREKVLEIQNGIQDFLASREYVGSKVTEHFEDSVRPVVLPSSASPTWIDQNVAASRWVNIELNVRIGDKVRFGFRGNAFFTRGYLDALVDELRLLGLGQDAVKTIQSRVEEEYRKVGFPDVEVVAYNFERPEEKKRQVTYVIREGQRVHIDSIDFDGNIIFSVPELTQQFFGHAPSWVKNRFYVRKEIEKAADLLVEWMREKGYLSARWITIHEAEVLKRKRQPQLGSVRSVRLLLYLYEGDQTRVDQLQVQGASVFTKSQISEFLRLQEGQPLNLFTFEEGLETLKKAYRDLGYLEFKILNEESDRLVSYFQENRLAQIHLEFSEGPISYISRVEIEGLKKTRSSVILRELRLKPGDVVSEERLKEAEGHLRKLSIFSDIRMHLVDDPLKPHHKVIRWVLSESDRGIWTWGPGMRNDLGVRVFSQLAYMNLWGENHTASFNLSVNRRFSNYHFTEGQAQFSYSWPWFAGVSELNFRPTLLMGQTQYINFAAATLTVSALWEKPLASDPLILGSFGYTLEKINQFNAVSAVDNQQLRIGTLTPKISIDLRDNPLSPSQGFFGTTWFDFAAPSWGSQAHLGYYRAQLRTDIYLPLFWDWVGYVSMRFGYEKSLLKPQGPNADSIPLIKQFALGGIGSVRGYQEQEINRQGQFVGNTLAYTNYRMQVDIPFVGALKLGFFLDAANLLIDRISLGRLLYGAGFGFHYQTPVGPVSLDWGFKLNPLPRAEPYVVHFSVGVI